MDALGHQQQIPSEPPPAYVRDQLQPQPQPQPRAPVPAWEASATGPRKIPRVQITRVKWTASDRFDRLMPPRRRYLGRSRRSFLIIAAALLVFVVGLVIGLAVGFGLRGKHSRKLPLPADAEPHVGDLTYYDPGLGACGFTSTSSDLVVSMSHSLWDASPRGSLCGKKIRAWRTNDGKDASVDMTVADRCVGCASTDIDTTLTAFKRLADPDLGRVDVTWAWL